MSAERVEVRAKDGRLLQVSVAGPADGRPLIFHMGTPSEGIVYERLVELGAERGVRHISYSRPGYGDSERRRGRAVGDCVEDVTALADHLGLGEFLTAGWSGGGPHALACAALLAERTIAAATIASVAPYEAAGLDFLAGMGEENVEEFSAALESEDAIRAFIEGQAKGVAALTGEQIADSLGGLIDEPDRVALDGPFADYLAELFRGALRNGPWGWVDDDLAFTHPWGFELGAIERPVAIWQGSEDRMVPFEHGRWLGEHLAGAETHLLEGEGHITLLLGRYGELLDGLLAAG